MYMIFLIMESSVRLWTGIALSNLRQFKEVFTTRGQFEQSVLNRTKKTYLEKYLAG